MLNRLSLSNWKKGDKIICVNNDDYLRDLTLNKEYVVVECIMSYGVEHVKMFGNIGLIAVYSTRFTNLKRLRQEKLEKINKLN